MFKRAIVVKGSKITIITVAEIMLFQLILKEHFLETGFFRDD